MFAETAPVERSYEPTPVTGKVVQFPGTQHKRIRQNCKTGQKQTVYPIRKYEEILAMANWLYQNKDTKYVLAFIVGCNIGLRANELLKLKYNQVFDQNGNVRYEEDIVDTSDVIYIYQGKTDKNRPVFLNLACKDALEWYFPQRGLRLHSDRYLFPSREGGHIEVDTFRKVLKEAAQACGVKVNIGTHTMRKTFFYTIYVGGLEKRTDISVIQAMAGHSDPRITMKYCGIDEYEFKRLYHYLGNRLDIISDQDFLGH